MAEYENQSDSHKVIAVLTTLCKVLGEVGSFLTIARTEDGTAVIMLHGSNEDLATLLYEAKRQELFYHINEMSMNMQMLGLLKRIEEGKTLVDTPQGAILLQYQTEVGSQQEEEPSGDTIETTQAQMDAYLRWRSEVEYSYKRKCNRKGVILPDAIPLTYSDYTENMHLSAERYAAILFTNLYGGPYL